MSDELKRAFETMLKPGFGKTTPAAVPASACKRCKGTGKINVVRHYHGDRDEHWKEPCPDCAVPAFDEGEPDPTVGSSDEAALVERYEKLGSEGCP